jgi:4-aminobutyrate aminotransferase-like enzyme
LNYGIIWKTIQKKDLLSFVGDTSIFLKVELERISKEKGVISNVRGYGTFLGFDTPSSYIAENM